MTDPIPDILASRRGVAPRAVTLVLTVLTGLLLYGVITRPLAQSHFLWGPETASQDILVRLRPKPPRHPDVVEVSLTNDRRKMLNADGDPVGGRSVYARLIQRLSADGAKVIVLDTYLPKRTSQPQDGALWRAMTNAAKVYVPMKYDPAKSNALTKADLLNLIELEKAVLHGKRTTVAPDAELEGYTWYRFAPPVHDFTRNAGAGKGGGAGVAVYQGDPSDGVVRHIQYAYLTNVAYPPNFPPSVLQNNWDYVNVAVPSEVLPAACRFFGVDKEFVGVFMGQNITIAGNLNPPVQIPVDEWARAPINFLGGVGVIPRVDAADVLDGKTAKGTFKNKLVVLGVMGPFAAADNLKTPFSEAQPRMDVTAQALSGVLGRHTLGRATHMAFVPLLLLALVAGLAVPAPRGVGRTLVAALLVLVVYAGIALAVAAAGTLLPVLTALLIVAFAWVYTQLTTALFPLG